MYKFKSISYSFKDYKLVKITRYIDDLEYNQEKKGDNDEEKTKNNK